MKKRSLPNALEIRKAFQEYKERVIENTKKEETIEWFDMDVMIPEKEEEKLNDIHTFRLCSYMVSDGKGNVTIDAHFGMGDGWGYPTFKEPTWYTCIDTPSYDVVNKPIENVRYWRPMEFTGPIDR